MPRAIRRRSSANRSPWMSILRVDRTARIGPTHVLCRMTMDNGDIGYGTFETQVFGAYPRYSFMA